MITIKKHDKEILQATIDSEKAVIEQLKKAYEQALKDINDQLAGLMSRADSDRQYVVYQKEYQKALQAQISGILDQLNAKEFDSVADYLNECYKDGFISVLYSLNNQGIPLIMPIDQQRVVQAVQLDSKISKGLYTRLGEDIKSLKKTISRQISRGLAGGMSYGEIARNIANSSRTGYNNAIRISRTEGNRIQNTAAMDAARKSKELGCDTKKQWLATLDGDTRKSHAQVDGEIKDLDEPFSNGLMYPGDPDGRAAEVVNCRCALAEVAAWALDEKELERLQRNAEFFGLDKSDSFEEFKKKYLRAVDNTAQNDIIKQNTQLLTSEQIISKAKEFAKSSDYDNVKSFQELRAVTNSKLKYDELPTILSKSDFKTAAKDKTILYRGVQSTESKTAKDIVNEFKYGRLWTGNSGGAAYGNGVYFTATERIAKYDYSGNNGEIIKMFMSDDAKIADYKTIMAEFAKTVTQQIRNTDYGQIVADVGQYAAMKGYDAIALNGYMKHDYVILLNRAKGIVEE